MFLLIFLSKDSVYNLTVYLLLFLPVKLMFDFPDGWINRELLCLHHQNHVVSLTLPVCVVLQCDADPAVQVAAAMDC